MIKEDKVLVKKCIFICVFHNIKFIDMLYLHLESIFTYGDLDEDTDILIYTSTDFMNKIKQWFKWRSFYDKILFETNDLYNSVDSACKAKLDLFEFESVKRYDKILYLDTDVLIKSEINKVFDIIDEDVIYALEEGDISIMQDGCDYWGKNLFGDDVNNYEDKSGFSSGVMLFNNCHKIRFLFDKIKEDIINRPNILFCYDQPYIVHNTIKFKLCNNKKLKDYVAKNDHDAYSDKTIIHFSGEPGVHTHKILNMANLFHGIINRKQMKVLVVTPTYGRLPFLGRLVASFLSQTYEDKELVIINDDANVIISCDEPNVICINMNKKILVAQKRNIATQVGYHDLYIHLDDDDIFLPERIANHVKMHQEHPEINLYRNKAAYTVYGEWFHSHPCTPNYVSYKRRGWFEMGGNTHDANYAEDVYLLENMSNVLEENRPDQLDLVYNYGGINYHLGCKPDSLSVDNIAKNQLIEMNVFKGEFKIIPDFDQFNNFVELDRKYKEINSEGTNNYVKLEHISLGKIRV